MGNIYFYRTKNNRLGGKYQANSNSLVRVCGATISQGGAAANDEIWNMCNASARLVMVEETSSVHSGINSYNHESGGVSVSAWSAGLDANRQ